MRKSATENLFPRLTEKVKTVSSSESNNNSTCDNLLLLPTRQTKLASTRESGITSSDYNPHGPEGFCNSSATLTKSQFSYKPRPRPEHPLTLIRFPSGHGNNDGDNEVSTSISATKVLERVSTVKDLLLEEKLFKDLVTPSPPKKVSSIHTGLKDKGKSSKATNNKLLNPTSLPRKSIDARPHTVLVNGRVAASVSSGKNNAASEKGNSPSAAAFSSSPNNIDNKERRKSKTAKGRKDLNTSSDTHPKELGLLFFSNVKKVPTPSEEDMPKNGQEGPTENRIAKCGIRRVPNSLSAKPIEKLQIIRTHEERVEMDGIGLKTFPHIGTGEGAAMKMLSLQRNLISRLENSAVSHLSYLVVLDLYDNRIERITGLQGLVSLRVLLLGKNRIRRIEGLEGLRRLEVFDLHGNQLRSTDGLGGLSCLKVLNLAGNSLRSIRNFGKHGLPSLIELNLKRNRIHNVDGLVKTSNLKKLLLANNDLQSFQSLLPLRKLVFLEEILLEPNPLCALSDCKHQVLTMVPWLVTLDRVEVTEGMRLEAKEWRKRMQVQAVEESRRKAEETKRLDAAATVSPGNSRERAIHQAKRRWESVRNFVKNSNSKPTNPSSSSPFGTNENETFSGRSETDADLHSHFGVSKSTQETLVGGTLDTGGPLESQEEDRRRKLNLAADLDEYQGVLVTPSERKEGKGPEDSCPPTMINDLEPQVNPKDYVNTNSIITQDSEEKVGLRAFPNSQVEDHEIVVATRNSEAQMDYSSPLTRNIITETRTTQSPKGTQCQSEDTGLFKQTSASERRGRDDDDPTGPPKNTDIARRGVSTGSNKKSVEENKEMKIAVVRPLVREPENLTHPNLEFSQLSPRHEKISFINENSQKESPNWKLERVKNDDIQLMDQYGNNLSECDGDSQSQILCQDLGLLLDKEGNTFTTDFHQHPSFPSSASSPDVDKDKVIQSNKIEIMKESDRLSASDNVSGKNMLRRTVSSLLLTDVDSAKENVCPTFTFNKEESGINKQGETRIINNNMAPPPSASTKFVPQVAKRNWSQRRSASFECGLTRPSSSDTNLHSDNEIDEDESEMYEMVTTASNTSDLSVRNKFGYIRRQLSLKSQKANKNKEKSYRCSSSSSAGHNGNRWTNLNRAKSGTVGNVSALSTSNSSSNLVGNTSSGSGGDTRSNKVLRRCDSAVSLGMTGTSPSEKGNNLSPSTSALKKQGADYLVEIDGKCLSIYGLGALKYTLTGFSENATCTVTTARFHYVSLDSVIPFLGKLRQIYPCLEHFQFRANNIHKLSQLNALSDLQGLSSLHIAKEGNPLVCEDSSLWVHYAGYRLSHWGLQIVNGKEVSSEYRGGQNTSTKCFEPLGFLALSCLPQTALTPLAKRLHMLHCFCCCTPSSSSEDSGKGKTGKYSGTRTGSPLPPSAGEQSSSSSSDICTSWDEDPVLLDVIGKEALVYCSTSTPPPVVVQNRGHHQPDDKGVGGGRNSTTTLDEIVDAGVEILEKLDKLEEAWPSVMREIVEEILTDYKFMDTYMKKELKKCQDAAIISAFHKHHNHHP